MTDESSRHIAGYPPQNEDTPLASTLRERPETMGKVAVLHETEHETIEVLDLGLASDLEWPGKVSAKALVESGIASEERIAESISRLNEFYVGVNPEARTRCIDGRHDPELDEANLGPQVPGGAPGAALAHRLGVDKDSLQKGSFLVDAEQMIATYRRLGFAPGGHRDENSAGEKAVGCGAIDGMDVIVATMTDPRLVDDHKSVVERVMGEELFNRAHYLQVLGASSLINGRSEDYFRGRETIMDILEKKEPKSVATLKGDHQEALVVFNMVPDTTMASNRFGDEFEFQAFGYDIWRSMQMAKKLVPRPEDKVDREMFVMARIMSTIATLMALTDGTQRMVIRRDSNNPLSYE